jgi:hypothetical protein
MSIIHLNNVQNYTFLNSPNQVKLKMQLFCPVIRAEDSPTAEVLYSQQRETPSRNTREFFELSLRGRMLERVRLA